MYVHRKPCSRLLLKYSAGKEHLPQGYAQGQKGILREAVHEGWAGLALCQSHTCYCPAAGSGRQVPPHFLCGGQRPSVCCRDRAIPQQRLLFSSEMLPKASQMITFGAMTQLGWVQVKDLSEVKYHCQVPWPPRASNTNTIGKFILTPQ